MNVDCRYLTSCTRRNKASAELRPSLAASSRRLVSSSTVCRRFHERGVYARTPCLSRGNVNAHTYKYVILDAYVHHFAEPIVERDFGDLPIRRSERRVVNTPLVFKRVLFGGRKEMGKRKEGTRKDKGVRERDRTEGRGETEKRERRRKETERESGRERVKPALNGEKG
ncbi:hypothetical protein TNCV_1001041 [Trichonephila clavipes]|nr:hypothetical protein TNCV_1001041 [Trichonephila clavipes]